MGDDPRLRVRLGRLPLRNPVICGSGEPVMTESGIRAALAAGAAGVIAKSINEQPAAARQLDHAEYAWLDRDADVINHADPRGALFCRSGLSQRDHADWFRAIAAIDRDAARDGRFVAASIVYGTAAGAVEIARLARATGLRVFELNVGAPHAQEAQPGAIGEETDPAELTALIRDVRAALGDMVLWVKLTGLSPNIPALARAAADGSADAVIAMGRFLAMVPSLDDFTPVLGSSAAYGGAWAVPIVCRTLALSRQAVGPHLPLIGTNGVRQGGDLLRMLLAGAWATEVLTIVMMEGFGALMRLRKEVLDFVTARGTSVEDLIGKAADKLGRYSEQPFRPGRWRDFVPVETLQTPATPADMNGKTPS
jgi:dihydroorotate dehydrogenase (NAD+) catalytic subunit